MKRLFNSIRNLTIQLKNAYWENCVFSILVDIDPREICSVGPSLENHFEVT